MAGISGSPSPSHFLVCPPPRPAPPCNLCSAAAAQQGSHLQLLRQGRLQPWRRVPLPPRNADLGCVRCAALWHGGGGWRGGGVWSSAAKSWVHGRRLLHPPMLPPSQCTTLPHLRIPPTHTHTHPPSTPPCAGPLSEQNIKDRYYGVNDPVAAKMMARADKLQKVTPPQDQTVCTLFVGGVPGAAMVGGWGVGRGRGSCGPGCAGGGGRFFVLAGSLLASLLAPTCTHSHVPLPPPCRYGCCRGGG